MANIEDKKDKLLDRFVLEVQSRGDLHSAVALGERLMTQLQRLDFSTFESLEPEIAVQHMELGPGLELIRLMGGAIRFVRSLPNFFGQAAGEQGEHPPIFEAEGQVPVPVQARLAQEGSAKPRLDRYLEDMDSVLQILPSQPVHGDVEHFLTLCERMVSELKVTLEELRQAHSNRLKWDLITCGEEGRRKTLKSLRIALVWAMRLGGMRINDGPLRRGQSELELALKVRQLIWQLGIDIRHIMERWQQEKSLEEQLLLLRDARFRMLTFFGDTMYQQLRAPDRFTLQRLFASLNKALEVGRDGLEKAYDILVQLDAHTQQMRSIGRRPLLVLHDKNLIERQTLALRELLVQLQPNKQMWQRDWQLCYDELRKVGGSFAHLEQHLQLWQPNTIDNLGKLTQYLQDLLALLQQCSWPQDQASIDALEAESAIQLDLSR